MKLLTEEEAAVILRCSRSKIKRLRMGGELPYVRGRPVLIEMSDLEAYVWQNRKSKNTQTAATTSTSARVDVAGAKAWLLAKKRKRAIALACGSKKGMGRSGKKTDRSPN
nr:hypothetical protein SHINE37_44668 [Rhizobiaceae bacterium]